MITLARIIKRFQASLEAQYQQQLLPSHHLALSRMKDCRSLHSRRIRMTCPDCDETRFIPHSCGHRHCPHCQAFESQQWLQRQLEKRLDAEYFMVTFTLPAQLRGLAWTHQRQVFNAMMQCAWATVKTFALNDKQLQGDVGAVAVLHTHSRTLDFHPHVHLVMPAAAVNRADRCWRTKGKKTNKSHQRSGYLFNHKALAKVFRAKMLDAVHDAELTLPGQIPNQWVVDCRSVGTGDKALVYLGRYLYRGVIQEKNILACKDGKVTFRYQSSETKRWETRTEPGAKFLWLVLQHILPRGFRRARNYGFLHPNSKHLITLIQWLTRLDPKIALRQLKPRPKMQCPCCGAEMKVIETRLPPLFNFAISRIT